MNDSLRAHLSYVVVCKLNNQLERTCKEGRVHTSKLKDTAYRASFLAMLYGPEIWMTQWYLQVYC